MVLETFSDGLTILLVSMGIYYLSLARERQFILRGYIIPKFNIGVLLFYLPLINLGFFDIVIFKSAIVGTTLILDGILAALTLVIISLTKFPIEKAIQ